jgi:hypothetical protein
MNASKTPKREVHWNGKRSLGSDPELVLRDWVECLKVMHEESGKCQVCEWSAD